MYGKISVIIPVYNNEKYLDKCVNSILKQTYKNLEIILIDDGSTDDSLNICNRLKNKDSRIIVLFQNKSGPSSARNAGIKISTGEFLAFADGDDWIESNMMECMVENLEREKADISFCGHFVDKEVSGKQIIVSSEDKIMDQLEFIRFLISNKGNDFVWNKMFRKSFWDGIKFPDGKIYEDIAVMNMVIKKVGKVSYTGTPLYHYLQHDGSLTRAKASINLFDGIRFRRDRLEYIKNNFPCMEKQAKKQYINFVIWSQYLIKKDKCTGSDLYDLQSEIKKILKEDLSCVGFKLFITGKIVLYAPFLFTIASKIVKCIVD